MAQKNVWSVRLTARDLLALQAIRDAYQVPTLSEAARRCIQQVARDRGLLREVEHGAQ